MGEQRETEDFSRNEAGKEEASVEAESATSARDLFKGPHLSSI